MGLEGKLRLLPVIKSSRLSLLSYAKLKLDKSNSEPSIGYCLSEWPDSNCQLGIQHTSCYCVSYRTNKPVLLNCDSEQGKCEPFAYVF
jgi:hypothetical protein